MAYTINAVWDGEAEVWVATSDDVPGLATEAATREALVQKLKAMVPELLELNAHLLQGRNAGGEMNIHWVEDQRVRLRA